jgi:Holliday junction DNA helicase RuvA
MPADEMVTAIRRNDVARLTRIPGIGKKTAERMVLELRDKMPAQVAGEMLQAQVLTSAEEDVLSALMNLGYQRPTAEKALHSIERNGGSFEEMFREALSALSK